MESSLTPIQKIAHNLGLIVLASQDLEKSLKFFVTLAESQMGVPIAKSQSDLKRRSLGEVVGRLMIHADASESDIETLHLYFKGVVDSRNKYVHHFYESFSEQLKQEHYSEILLELGEHYKELQHLSKQFLSASTSIAKSILDEHAITS